MSDQFEKIAEYLGQLSGAARHDWVAAAPGDVGLNGVPIRGWREAYFEGCKDMAEGVFARFPEERREALKAIAQESFHRTFEEEKLRAAHGQSEGNK